LREREREATHEKATDWVEERKRLSKRAREREREREKKKSRLKISNWQELGGFTSVQNFLQAPQASCSKTGH
jgi:hypothetical protein